MSPARILFINGLPSGGIREQELTRAEALSHAAWVSHRRPRAHMANTGKRRTPAAPKGSLSLVVDKPTRPVLFQEENTEGKDESCAVTVVSMQPEPLSILKEGNSDPFQAWAIKLTPRANQIIAFIRDVFLPSNYRTSSPAWIHRIPMQNEWAGGLLTLQSECCAQGFLLAFLTCLAKISPQDAYVKDHLKLKSETTGALSRQIGKGRDNNVETINCIAFLFGAECFAGNRREAALHGKMLQALLQRKAQTEGGPTSIDQALMTRLLWFDFQLAQSHFTRTIIDNKWATGMFSPTFEPLDAAIDNATSELTTNLDDSIVAETMRSYFIRFRQSLWIWLSPHDLSFLGTDAQSIACWLLARIFLITGHLLNHYLDLRDLRAFLKNRHSSASGDHMTVQRTAATASWGTQCCLILGLFLALGLSEGDCQIQRSSVFPGVKMVLANLRGVTEVILSSSLLDHGGVDTSRNANPPPAGVSQNACLWALFLGAALERKQFNLDSTSPSAWFNQRFKLVASQMGLSSWPLVKRILVRFIYFDDMESEGSEWVPKLLRENNPVVDKAQSSDQNYASTGSLRKN